MPAHEALTRRDQFQVKKQDKDNKKKQRKRQTKQRQKKGPARRTRSRRQSITKREREPTRLGEGQARKTRAKVLARLEALLFHGESVPL